MSRKGFAGGSTVRERQVIKMQMKRDKLRQRLAFESSRYLIYGSETFFHEDN